MTLKNKGWAICKKHNRGKKEVDINDRKLIHRLKTIFDRRRL